jgi:hypothetical protein
LRRFASARKLRASRGHRFPEDTDMAQATRANQGKILADLKTVLKNQGRIQANQKTILANQRKILANQKRILAK